MILRYSVNTSIDNAFNALADFRKFCELHPYMTRVEQTGDSFLVEEVVPLLGFIKVPNVYSVQVTSSPGDCKIMYRSQVKPSVSLEIIWTIRKGNPVTITEDIRIKANPVVTFIMSSMMKKAHRKVIEGMNP